MVNIMQKGRPEGPSVEKLMSIMSILQAYPDGIYLRMLAREAKLPLSTVHYYLEKYLESFIDSTGYRRPDGKAIGIRMIKLKKEVTVADVLRHYKVRKELRES
jgi:hypothetical protein